MTDLNLFQTTVLSEWGQDGVLEKIFDIIGTTNKFFVEFGSSGNDSGKGNTAYLRRRGFDGLLMDGSERPYNIDILDKKHEVKIEFIKASNINELFKKYNVPNEFDFLSIDIDGQDFHVWNSIDSMYIPRVVSIEMNYHIEPGIDKVMHVDENWIWPGSEQSGASVTALKKLGNKKGYSLVATCMSDAIFVRNDLVKDSDNNELFKNINDEYELVKLNTDIKEQNSKFNFDKNHFDRPLFLTSEHFL
uniref:Methyltransferase FkbM domain-containing protein n=1 Tax=viral metagenome TaxID=1070528 RepID=A0A6C0ESA2_9ZZZZ